MAKPRVIGKNDDGTLRFVMEGKLLSYDNNGKGYMEFKHKGKLYSAELPPAMIKWLNNAAEQLNAKT